MALIPPLIYWLMMRILEWLLLVRFKTRSRAFLPPLSLYLRASMRVPMLLIISLHVYIIYSINVCVNACMHASTYACSVCKCVIPSVRMCVYQTCTKLCMGVSVRAHLSIFIFVCVSAYPYVTVRVYMRLGLSEPVYIYVILVSCISVFLFALVFCTLYLL